MAKEEKEVLHRVDGKNVILKIKSALDIGKMCFTFVQYGEDKKASATIDCYMDAEEFGALLCNRIATGVLYKEIAAEKAKGEQYPRAVWTSPIGGKKTKDGGAINRSFTIAPGSRSEVLFTANEYPAQVNQTGAYVTVKGAKPLATIRVPARFDDLRLLAYKWRFLEEDYMAKKYTVDAMRSNYRRDQVPDAYAPTDYSDMGGYVPYDNDPEPAPAQQNASVVQSNSGESAAKPDEPAPEFHHGDMKAKQAFIMKNGVLAIFCSDFTSNQEKMILYFSWDMADKRTNGNKEAFDRFVRVCQESTEPDKPELRKPIPFKAMYQVKDGKNFFYRFS